MREVVPGVFILKRTMGSNVYLIPGNPTAIIDAGFPMDCRKINNCLKYRGERGEILVVATHYHLDHVGPMAKLKEKAGVTVAAHVEDAKIMEGVLPYRRFKLDTPRTIYYSALSPFFTYRNVEVEFKLDEGDRLDVLGGIEVVHTPGHTDGSIVLCQKEKGILFSGDTIRNEGGVIEGPPPLFSPGIEEAFLHIRKKVLDLDFDILLPGHGEPVARGARVAVERMMREQGRLG